MSLWKEYECSITCFYEKFFFFHTKVGNAFGVLTKSEGSHSISIIGERHVDDYIVLWKFLEHLTIWTKLVINIQNAKTF